MEGTVYKERSLFLPRDLVPESLLKGSLRFGEFPDGTPRVLVKEHKNHFEVPLESFTDEQLKGFGSSTIIDLRPKEFRQINLKAKDCFELRENQREAWGAFAATKKGILNLACGKGKTILGWLKAAHEKVPTLIVSPQKAHLENWLSELEAFFDFEGETGWIQGKRFDVESDICFATIQTLARRSEEGKLPKEFFENFGLIIYDECHCMAADMFSKAADIGLGIRIGLSATPNRTDRNEGIFLSHLGPIFYTDLSQDLSPTVNVVETGLFFRDKQLRSMHDRSGQLNVGLMRQELARHSARNDVIHSVIRWGLAQGRTLYVLSHSVEHVEYLHEVYPDSTMIHGKVKSSERLERLHGSKLVFATVGVGKEAYNRKDLDTLLLVTPFAAKSHSAITFQQSVGRIQRKHPGKKHPMVFLFLDSNLEMCRGMIYSLIRESKKQGFEVKKNWRPN